MEALTQPVVIDNGTGTLKAGLAGSQSPTCVFPNYVGTPRKEIRSLIPEKGDLSGEIFVGLKAEQHKGALKIQHPVEFGSVKLWREMEIVWDSLYGRDLLNIPREEHAVLLTEVPFEKFENREKSAEIFFEKFNVPGLHFALQAVLSLYATGRTTGVVCDSGEGVTQAVPIYQGYAIPHCMNRTEIAGQDVTRFLKDLLREENSTHKILRDMDVMKVIKEKLCFVSPNLEDEQSQEPVQYRLPDGERVDIGYMPRYTAPEVLFTPNLIRDESPGVHELIHETIGLADIDMRRTLRENIVVSGGTTLLTGFTHRLANELKKLVPNNVKVKLTAPRERILSTWIGGSIMASLESFQQTMVTKREYSEQGSRIFLENRC